MEDSVIQSFNNAMKNAAVEEWPPLSLDRPAFVRLEDNETKEVIQISQETQDGKPVEEEDHAQDMESDYDYEEDLDEEVRKNMFDETEDVPKGSDPQKHAPNMPPVNTRMLLDNLDKTPRSPAIVRANQKEVDAIKEKNKNEDDPFQILVKIKPDDFVAQIENSKKNMDAVMVQGEEGIDLPIDFKGDIVIKDRKDNFVHSIWEEVYKIYRLCNPSMARNPEVWAEPVHRFLDTFLGGDWANVRVKGQTATNLIKHKLPRALFKGKGKINEKEAIEMSKKEKTRKSDSDRMDVDPKEGIKPSEYKLPVGTRAEKMKNVVAKPASPIKVSKIPKPLPVPVVELKKKKTTFQDKEDKTSKVMWTFLTRKIW
jgi:hypothetical protein